MKAWHFVNSTLRDGQPIPADGVTLHHDGGLKMCRAGFHASKRIINALAYSPGNTICRVEVGGEIIHDDDKMVARERTILWRVDAEDLLRDFARRCAIDVLPLWDAPEIVVQYLKTGDESLRAAARAAAWGAARDAAWGATRDDARDAAWGAAWGAAWAAAWGATRDDARDAAWAAAGDAAWDAAWAAAWDKQNRRLTSMVIAVHRKNVA